MAKLETAGRAEEPTLLGMLYRWKAPWVRRIALPFARGRVVRPLRRSRESGVARRAREGPRKEAFAAQVSPYLRRSGLATWGA
jgi:hypothetical protein